MPILILYNFICNNHNLPYQIQESIRSQGLLFDELGDIRLLVLRVLARLDSGDQHNAEDDSADGRRHVVNNGTETHPVWLIG